MNEEICEGDVVQLNSGSEKMTVVSVAANKVITVAWYDHNVNIMHQADLPSKAVHKSIAMPA